MHCSSQDSWSVLQQCRYYVIVDFTKGKLLYCGMRSSKVCALIWSRKVGPALLMAGTMETHYLISAAILFTWKQVKNPKGRIISV